MGVGSMVCCRMVMSRNRSSVNTHVRGRLLLRGPDFFPFRLAIRQPSQESRTSSPETLKFQTSSLTGPNLPVPTRSTCSPGM